MCELELRSEYTANTQPPTSTLHKHTMHIRDLTNSPAPAYREGPLIKANTL